MMKVILSIFSQYANGSSDTSVIVKTTTNSIICKAVIFTVYGLNGKNSIWSTEDELLEELRTQVIQITIGKK